MKLSLVHDLKPSKFFSVLVTGFYIYTTLFSILSINFEVLGLIIDFVLLYLIVYIISIKPKALQLILSVWQIFTHKTMVNLTRPTESALKKQKI